MSLRSFMDGIAPHFEKGGKLSALYPAFEAIDTALYTPGRTTAGASHVRDGLDLKRIMMTVWLCAWIPAIVGSYYVGLQANEAMQAAGLTGISVDFTLPDLVETIVAQDRSVQPETVEAIRRELDTKDAGGLKAVGGEAYLPLLYATGPFAEAMTKLRRLDAGGVLATRLDGLEAIAERAGDAARITLDPTERYGFEYQSWFGFTLYTEGLRGAVGRGGTYRIGGTDEAATGFTLYVDRLAEVSPEPDPVRAVFLPIGHDREAAAKTRAEGLRTIAQLSHEDEPKALGCTHILEGTTPVPLD